MKTILALTIAALLALVRAAQPAPTVTPMPPAAVAPSQIEMSATATVAVPPTDAPPPCAITYIDPWGRWHCGAPGVIPPALDPLPPYPGPCVTVGLWQGRAVCDDLAPTGYPAP